MRIHRDPLYMGHKMHREMPGNKYFSIFRLLWVIQFPPPRRDICSPWCHPRESRYIAQLSSWTPLKEEHCRSFYKSEWTKKGRFFKNLLKTWHIFLFTFVFVFVLDSVVQTFHRGLWQFLLQTDKTGQYSAPWSPIQSRPIVNIYSYSEICVAVSPPGG